LMPARFAVIGGVAASSPRTAVQIVSRDTVMAGSRVWILPKAIVPDWGRTIQRSTGGTACVAASSCRRSGKYLACANASNKGGGRRCHNPRTEA
jgi:hypothetical protein